MKAYCNFSGGQNVYIKNSINIITNRIMILSTTPTIEGQTIREYKGVVTGETIIGANFVKDFFAGIRDIVGGRSGAYERVLREAKDTSMKEMEDRAREMGLWASTSTTRPSDRATPC